MEIATASEVRIGGHQMKPRSPLTRVGIVFGLPGNWKADRYGIWEQLDSQNGFFNCYRSPRPKWANWTRRLHRNVEANHILLAGETSRDNTSHSAAISALSAAVQQADSSPRAEAKIPPSSLPKKPVKRQTILSEHRGKGLGMRWPNAETNRSGSTELIAVLISRDPI